MNRTRIVGLILGFVGTIILIVTIGWLPWIGITILLWGNNLELDGRENHQRTKKATNAVYKRCG